MWSLYETVFRAHDLRFVVLAIGVCALGSLTGAAIARYSLEPGSYRNRLERLVLAGVVTGLGIWTTHFTTMLGYRSDLALRYDLRVAALSLFMCVAFTLAGGLAGLIGKRRGVVAGLLVGCGIAVAHFLDMHALRFAGSVEHDPFTSLVAVALGLSLAGLSGHALVRSRTQAFPWKAVVPMFAAVLSLHFIAMSGATFTLTGVMPSDLNGTASADELANVIVAAFLVILVIAIAYTLHSARLAQATVQEQRRLI